jgi:hypothetical protein
MITHRQIHQSSEAYRNTITGCGFDPSVPSDDWHAAAGHALIYRMCSLNCVAYIYTDVSRMTSDEISFELLGIRHQLTPFSHSATVFSRSSSIHSAYCRCFLAFSQAKGSTATAARVVKKLHQNSKSINCSRACAGAPSPR